MVDSPNGCTSRSLSNWCAGLCDLRLNGKLPQLSGFGKGCAGAHSSDDLFPWNLRKDDYHRVICCTNCCGEAHKALQRTVLVRCGCTSYRGAEILQFAAMDMKVTSTSSLAVSRTPHPGTTARYPEFSCSPPRPPAALSCLGRQLDTPKLTSGFPWTSFTIDRTYRKFHCALLPPL
jgi:hypothetical protein